VLKESWSLLPDEVQSAFLEAECKLDALSFIDLGGKRSFAVGECLLWTELCGMRFSAQITAAASLETMPKDLSKLLVVAKDAAAIRFANYTATSIASNLCSPVQLIHKGTKRQRPRRQRQPPKP
jgi:hypothetical protein